MVVERKKENEMWSLDTLTGSVCVMVGMMAVVPTAHVHASKKNFSGKNILHKGAKTVSAKFSEAKICQSGAGVVSFVACRVFIFRFLFYHKPAVN